MYGRKSGIFYFKRALGLHFLKKIANKNRGTAGPIRKTGPTNVVITVIIIFNMTISYGDTEVFYLSKNSVGIFDNFFAEKITNFY